MSNPGPVFAEGEWSNGGLHGLGVQRHIDGNIWYAGQWQDGRPHGLGVRRSVRRTHCTTASPVSPEPAAGPEPAHGDPHTHRRAPAHISTRGCGAWDVTLTT
eukprot:GHVU01204546.1.p1 GENE.GHVU01204546.1~~GHVU01204546.1.p1  ORF type:complete len:102 (-),score=2.56 GHVU01204546.1:125-430(-)